MAIGPSISGPSRICSISSETTRFELEGITGEADYGPLPTWLLPWLQTTGHLHTGPHRIAGAGGWTVQVWK